MHLRLEKAVTARCDCPILSLSWMGKVPEELPDDEGWRLNRTHYYQEGWLAVGNMRGIVGVTFTTCHCRKLFDSPLRTNYNLRGHRSEVALVKWNEPYQKLASCDSSGIIFVWIKYEGRWSIELINDRNTQVMDFSWSHDGRMALICYQDGFVLVGSVAGQRYWSSMLNLEGTITCGVWSPDDQQVLFGTTDGQIIVMDAHGTMVAQVGVLDDVAVTSMSWSCQKFKMEESGREDDEEEGPAEIPLKSLAGVDQTAVLGVCFKSGLVYIMKSYDDIFPVIIPTGLRGVKMDWTNAGDLLAIAGCASNSRTGEFTNILQFYTQSGAPRHCSVLPYTQHPVSALTWGHNDKRLFVATGPQIHIAWVSRQVATLQRLCSHVLRTLLKEDGNVVQLPLPRRLKNQVGSLFCATIKSYIPEPPNLREFASRPPMGNIRYHCTMIRHDDDLSLSSGTCYTLYLEYLGGLVPLLKGKRISKIRPEFVIYDPQVGAEGYPGCESGTTETKSIISASATGSGIGAGNGHVSGIGGGHLVLNRMAELSDSEYEDGCASPRMQRRRRHMKRLLREQLELELRLLDNLTYVDTLPEQERLVEVTSNIWGTKFKLHGVASFLPTVLGHVTYRTSLLHLQPRQMTLVVTELTGELSAPPDNYYDGPNVCRVNDGKDDDDEDDDDEPAIGDDGPGVFRKGDGAPVAPMTPNHNRLRLRASAPRAEIDSDPDEYPYVDLSANPHLLGLLSIERLCNSSAGTPSDNTPDTPVKTPDRDPLTLPNLMDPSSSPRRTASCSGSGGARRWAEKAAELRFIDEEEAHALRTPVAQARLMSRCRSRSVGHLNSIDYVGGPIGEPSDSMGGVLRDSRRRLVLSQTVPLKMPPSCKSKTPLKKCGKSRSLDSGPAKDISHKANADPAPKSTNPKRSPAPATVSSEGAPRSSSLTRVPSPRLGNGNVETSQSPLVQRRALEPQSSPKLGRLQSSAVTRCARDIREDRGGLLRSPQANRRGPIGTSAATLTPPHSPSLASRRGEVLPTSSASTSPILPRCGTTTPGSPQTPTRNFKANQRKNSLLGRRSLLNSPLLGRRALQTRPPDSSDDEVVYSGDEAFSDGGRSYDVRPRMKKGRSVNGCRSASPALTPAQRREFVMHNKAPLWNESSQVYQLDFGGRVTQESAKNFQIEFRGTQVMQFGRIDGNAYTLDFQYPFTAIQAFAVALANVTQRLK